MATKAQLKHYVIDVDNKPNLDKDWENRISFIDEVDLDGFRTLRFAYDGTKDYRQTIKSPDGNDLFGHCSCPWGSRNNASKPCKHLYAAYVWVTSKDHSTKLETVEEVEVLEPVVVTEVKTLVENEQRIIDISKADDIRPTPKAKKFWPSKIDLVEKCPASYVDAGEIDVEIDKVNDAANIGRCVHSIAERIVTGEITDIDSTLAISESIKFGVDGAADDIEMLAGNVMRAWHGSGSWAGLKGYFIEPKVETYGKFQHTVKNPNTGVMEDILFSGFMDVSEVISAEEIEEASVKNWGITLDWKTGRKGDDAAHKGQMMAYATMLAADNPKLEQVTTIICWVRDKSFSIVTFKREEIRDWFKNFIHRHAFWDGRTYSPGDHCSWCKRFYDCPARSKMINSAVNDLVAYENDKSLVLNSDGELVDPDKLFDAYNQAKVLKRMIDSFMEDLKVEVRKRGDVPIPQLDGKGFGYKSRRGNATFDTFKAWGVLQDHFTDDEMSNIISIGKGKLETVAKSKAEKGKKQKFFAEIMGELETNGAINIGEDVFTFGIKDMEVDDG